MAILNKQQYIASRLSSGVSLVIAGAGTGKTKVLVEKAKNIIRAGAAKPQEILILTFSNKAAGEIDDRLVKEIGTESKAVYSGTFHSFCLSLLKNFSEEFTSFYGFKYFPKILDQEARDNLIRELLAGTIDRFLGLPANVVAGLLESTDRLDKRTFKKLKRIGIFKELEEFNLIFKKHKILNNLIDFNDMIEFSIDLLSRSISLRKQIVNKYKYVLVDEFQDTSENNFALLKLVLPSAGRNLFLVGDDWQSIYGFRGSNIDYIVKMKKYFPEAMVYKLKLNYRSNKEIVELSNNFIKNNRYRTSKRLKSVKGRGGNVADHPVSGVEEELKVISAIIKEIEDKKKNSKDIAILYRNNWQGRYISDKLGPFINDNGFIKPMTIHASKGLEFNTVILAGVADGIIPDPSSDIEEERRLLYVALTRARENLHIMHYISADGSLSLFAEELGLSK